MRDRWQTKATEVGLDRELIAQSLGHEHPGPTVLTVEALAAKVTEHASHFDRRDAIQAVADSLPAGAPAQEVEATADAFLASAEVREIAADPKGARYTTERIWALEQEALKKAGAMVAGDDRAAVPEVIVARTLAARPSMKPDQAEMVERLLGGSESLVVVIGEAGTGKSYATEAAAEGWAAAGFPVRAAAPTWRATNVLRSEGLDATSLAKLLAELDGAAEKGRRTLAPGSVLLVDEAGMVGSADLARLIDHAEAGQAKLVLIGDPAQLGEIDAGGLFASIADRSDPIRLDEVIRHSHELDREGARRIRLGEGGEAFSVYLQEGRVLVAADPAERREAMVRDWWQSFGAGEDALMVAKRNSEVERLNSLAREVMKAEGRLGPEEIEVDGERFASGDQVITRINDHRHDIYNRERWRVTEVEVESRRVWLDGIDTRKRVCVDSVYLERVNERDGAPALQHAYAATTYQAQGATVDRAFVMADPSMTREEFYVAASRSREKTHFYATPEVQAHREEFAPTDPSLRKDLKHIAEAAERSGAQVSAHDRALRERYAGLSTPELHHRREELRSEAQAERRNEEHHGEIDHKVGLIRIQANNALSRAERIGELPRRQRKAEREQIADSLEDNRQAVERWEARRSELDPLTHDARAEAAAVDRLIAERERAALTAVRISPPDYLANEIGVRPDDPGKRQEWDRAARRIEGYRERFGVRDRDLALGREPVDRTQHSQWESERQRLDQSRRSLELVRARSLDRAHEVDFGIGM